MRAFLISLFACACAGVGAASSIQGTNYQRLIQLVNGGEGDDGDGRGRQQPKIRPVQEFDSSKMVGRMYEVMGNLMSFALLNTEPQCTTNDYYMADRGALQFKHTYWTNEGRKDDYRRATVGRMSFPRDDGRMHVASGLLTKGRYMDETNAMVIAVGPLNADDQYDYVITSDTRGTFLSVQARDITSFTQNYYDEVTAMLQDMGFVAPHTVPLLVNHTDCEYRDPRSPTMPDKEFTGPEIYGRWFQMMGNVYNEYSMPFAKAAKCISIDYIPVEQGESVRVIGGKMDVKSGSMFQEEGVLQQTEAGIPGIMRYEPTSSSSADYWILGAGPVERNETHVAPYQWMVASDPHSLTLWVLARDTSHFNKYHKNQVLALLAHRGFDKFYNKPYDVDHNDCHYIRKPEDW